MKFATLLVLIHLLFMSILEAQSGRYQQAIFSQNNVQTNIQYGTADSYDALGLNIPLPQYLDFYEPVGDTATKRPLVLVFFGGAFLVGDKGMQDMVAWCDSLTAYGYACAAVNYRIGFNLLSTASSIRAGYRGLQDARSAVRYMKEFHQQFKIDTNLIFMVGNSAGSINAIQAAYGAESDRPIETYGVSGSLADNNDLGCFDCSGNTYQHTVDIAGVVGCWGAVVDLGGLDSSDTTPIIMFHGTDDTTVPIDSGAPFNNNGTFPIMYGSRIVHDSRVNFGLPSELHVYQGLPHNFYYDGLIFPNAYWDTIWHLTHPFLCRNNPYCNTILSINNISSRTSIDCYPNPAKDIITVKLTRGLWTNEERELTVYSLLGKEMVHYSVLNENEFQLKVKDWVRGVYIVHVKDNEGVYVQKIQLE